MYALNIRGHCVSYQLIVDLQLLVIKTYNVMYALNIRGHCVSYQLIVDLQLLVIKTYNVMYDLNIRGLQLLVIKT